MAITFTTNGDYIYRQLWVKLREFVELIDCIDDMNQRQLKGLIKFFKLRELKINFRYRIKKLLISIAKFYGIFPGSIVTTTTLDLNTIEITTITGEILHYTKGLCFEVFWFYPDVTADEINKGSFRCCSAVNMSELTVLSNPDKFSNYGIKVKSDNKYFAKIDADIKYLLKIVDLLPNPLEISMCKPLELGF